MSRSDQPDTPLVVISARRQGAILEMTTADVHIPGLEKKIASSPSFEGLAAQCIDTIAGHLSVLEAYPPDKYRLQFERGISKGDKQEFLDAWQNLCDEAPREIKPRLR